MKCLNIPKRVIRIHKSKKDRQHNGQNKMMDKRTNDDLQNIIFLYSIVVCLMLFNATFNNITHMSWWSVLLVEETGGPGENHRPVASH
jgi:hypothetical protein